jgi:hypothetical protein
MKHIRLFTILGLLLCSYARVHAQANLSIQGTIQRASGANLDDGDYAMTFRLYESATGCSENPTRSLPLSTKRIISVFP